MTKISYEILECEIKNKHRKTTQLIRQLRENNQALMTRIIQFHSQYCALY